MTTPYRPVQFSNEQVTRPRLQQMANNVQWIFENTPRMRYAALGIVRESGVKMVSGRTLFPASTTAESRTMVYFGNFFSAGCKPIVVANAQPRGGRKFVTVYNLAGSGDIDHLGFRALVASVDSTRMPYSGWVHWHAIGY